jgi:hypothetical protein
MLFYGSIKALLRQRCITRVGTKNEVHDTHTHTTHTHTHTYVRTYIRIYIHTCMHAVTVASLA